MARSRWVRSLPVRASTSSGVSTRGSVRGARTNGTPCEGRFPSRRVGSPRGTGLSATSPRATRKAYSPEIVDNRRRTVRNETPASPPATATGPPAWWMSRAGALCSDVPQDSARPDLADRQVNDGEEDLQAEPHRQHRVRPRPCCDELDVVSSSGSRNKVRRPASFATGRRRHGNSSMGHSSRRVDESHDAPDGDREDHPHIKQIRTLTPGCGDPPTSSG